MRENAGICLEIFYVTETGTGHWFEGESWISGVVEIMGLLLVLFCEEVEGVYGGGDVFGLEVFGIK